MQLGDQHIFTAKARPETLCFVNLLRNSVVAATSDNETDHGEGKQTRGFLVHWIGWRLLEYLQLLMDLDDLATLDRYNPNTKRQGQGSVVRQRFWILGLPVTQSLLNQSNPPWDLLINCYNEDWARLLCKEDYQTLITNVKPAIQLMINSSLKR